MTTEAISIHRLFCVNPVDGKKKKGNKILIKINGFAFIFLGTCVWDSGESEDVCGGGAIIYKSGMQVLEVSIYQMIIWEYV